MPRKLTIAVLAACALATSAPAAHAEHVTFHCDFDAVAQEAATGGEDTFTGVARGYVVSQIPGEAVSIRCYVRVDGVDVSGTPTGTGTNVAVTAGQVTYTAGYGQDVDVCAEKTAGAESDTTCFDKKITGPPQGGPDVLHQLFQLVADTTPALDAVVCSAIRTLGVPGLVNPLSDVTGVFVDPADCDVYFAGDRLYDFVPYND